MVDVLFKGRIIIKYIYYVLNDLATVMASSSTASVILLVIA